MQDPHRDSIIQTVGFFNQFSTKFCENFIVCLYSLHNCPPPVDFCPPFIASSTKNLFVLNTLYSLLKNFLYYKGKVFSCLSFRNLIKIHKYSNKWSLSISCHKCYYLILNHLYTTFNFISYS